MANLEFEPARALAEEIVQDSAKKSSRPMLGTQLKLALTARAAESGRPFDEKQLGFGSFAHFVSRCPGLVLARRPGGGDFLVMPKGKASLHRLAVTRQRDRIRREFWFAFLSFPQSGIRRVYDGIGDRIIYEEDTKLVGSNPIIEPFSKEEQLRWRKEFVATLESEPKEQIERALGAGNPFREFALTVRRRPQLYQAWNAIVFDKVRSAVEKWAKENSVPEEYWLESDSLGVGARSDREEIYELLDRLPLERILDLRIPLRWLLEARKSPKGETKEGG